MEKPTLPACKISVHYTEATEGMKGTQGREGEHPFCAVISQIFQRSCQTTLSDGICLCIYNKNSDQRKKLPRITKLLTETKQQYCNEQNRVLSLNKKYDFTGPDHQDYLEHFPNRWPQLSEVLFKYWFLGAVQASESP